MILSLIMCHYIIVDNNNTGSVSHELIHELISIYSNHDADGDDGDVDVDDDHDEMC